MEMEFLIGGKTSVFLYGEDSKGKCRLYMGGDEPTITGTIDELAEWFKEFAEELKEYGLK